MHILINGKEIECKKGERLLWVALDNGIYIPNLCAIRERKEPYGGCRLCYVEVRGQELPVTACTLRVEEGMIINTKGEKALRLAKTAFELILSNHPVDCKNCKKSGLCELQKISKHLGINLRQERFQKLLRDLPIDESSPAFIYNPNKCVLCGRCVWLSREKLNIGAIGFGYRGFKRYVTTFNDEPIGLTECRERTELVDICPVGAFVRK